MAPSEFSRSIINTGRLIARAAAEQGGIISGDNPTAINLADPIRIWIIQVVIIICMTQLLSVILSRIRQPRVIAEVIGGVLLGPTVMGRIPRFSQTIFPPDSLPFLNLTATVGLVLYLFLVGLEIDTRVLKRNARASGLISMAGLILPFGLGAAIAVPIYHTFINPAIGFGLFLLFVGVAIAITAFPVLCRILTELSLLDTEVGIITLSAGIGNDVVGWILLALTVTLANATSGLTALWILLASVGWTLFMLFPVRWVFVWLARRTGSLENGPTPFMMTVTLLVVLISSFMTDVLGVHAIFGGFIAGLIVPHEGGFAIALVDKLEDLVTLLLIPIYFALSGLKTNMGLLDTGITWAYIVLICTVAFFGKFLGCAVTARLCGEPLRESATIGVLMSCKGLVELIVLNIGLTAGILDTRVFSMFVLHALVLTFLTTPLTVWLYPEGKRVRITNLDKRPSEKGSESHPHTGRVEDFKTSLSMVLHKIEQLPAVTSVMQLLQSLPTPTPTATAGPSSNEKERESSILKIDGLRLIELTARTSAVMRNTEADELLRHDTMISVFRTFGHFNRIPTTASLAVVSDDAFSSTVVKHAQESGSDLVIIPWTSNAPDSVSAANEHSSHSPFDSIFGKSNTDQASSVVYSHFVRKVFHESPVDAGLFVDRGVAQANVRNGSYGNHIVVPFFGGPDDRLALSFVVQLCANPSTTATVVRIRRVESADLTTQTTADDAHKADLTILSASAFPDTIYGQATTEHRLASETADNLAWGRFTNPSSQDLNPAIHEALTRINFSELSSATPLHAVLNLVAEESKKTQNTWRSLLIVTGRARRMAVENHHVELRQISTEHSAPSNPEISRTMGDVAGALFISGSTTSMIVMQAASAE